MSPRDFICFALSNTANATLLSRLPSLALNQCYLTAGCLFQTAWNRSSGLAANWGIKDYDVFYFDDRDLSWDSEDSVIRRVNVLAGDLGIRVETRNQARVHLWYERRFGANYPKLTLIRRSTAEQGFADRRSVEYAPDGPPYWSQLLFQPLLRNAAPGQCGKGCGHGRCVVPLSVASKPARRRLSAGDPRSPLRRRVFAGFPEPDDIEVLFRYAGLSPRSSKCH